MDDWDTFGEDISIGEESSIEFSDISEESYELDEEVKPKKEEPKVIGLHAEKVQKSKKEILLDSLSENTEKVQDAIIADSWSRAANFWNDLEKSRMKARNILKKDGYPGFYLNVLVELDENIEATKQDEEAIDKLDDKDIKGFNALRQKFMKFKSSNKDVLRELERYKENPEPYHALDDYSAYKIAESQIGVYDDDFFSKPLEYWYEQDEVKKTQKVSKTETETRATKELSTEEEVKEVKRKPWTQARIKKKVKKILSLRGTKNVNRNETILMLTFLYEHIEGFAAKIQVAFYIMNAFFDTKKAFVPLASNVWKNIYNWMVVVLNTLKENEEIKLIQDFKELDELAKKLDQIDLDATSLPENYIFGSIVSNIEKLNDSVYHSLQLLEKDSDKIKSLLKRRNYLIYLIHYAREILSSRGKDISRLAYFELGNIHYETKMQPISDGVLNEDVIVENIIDKKNHDFTPINEILNDEIIYVDLELPPCEYPTELAQHVDDLAYEIYECNDSYIKPIAVLYHTFFLAINGDYYRARDLFLISHVNDRVSKARHESQVLFNRCIAALGIAAFEKLRIHDSHSYLNDIGAYITVQKFRELFAQGMMKGERTREQLIKEQRRQIPIHMHISQSLVECILLICSMIIEMPNYSKLSMNKRKPTSKRFKKVYEQYETRELNNGPPENNEEKIIFAANRLYSGDWKACFESIESLDFFSELNGSKALKEKLFDLIKREALRAYILNYGQYFESYSLESLSTQFELERNVVHSILSKTIATNELNASLDQENDVIIINAKNETRLQRIAYACADNIAYYIGHGDRSNVKKK